CSLPALRTCPGRRAPESVCRKAQSRTSQRSMRRLHVQPAPTLLCERSSPIDGRGDIMTSVPDRVPNLEVRGRAWCCHKAMKVEDLSRLFDYGYWANQKLLETVCQLKSDEYTQPLAGSKGSVRDTMVHILSAEWGWLDRCGGPKRGLPLNPADYPT